MKDVEEGGDNDATYMEVETQPCKMCEFKGQPASVAEYLCERCDKVTLCTACKDEHQTLRFTSKHVVTRLGQEGAETPGSTCDLHGMAQKLVCTTCDVCVCGICVVVSGHGEHKVENIEDVIRKEVDDVQDMLKQGEAKLEELGQLVLSWRGKMTKKVEDVADAVIKRVVDRKEELKADLKRGPDVSQLVDMADDIPEVQRSIQDKMKSAKAVLKETSLDPSFLTRAKDSRKRLRSALDSDKFERELQWKCLLQPMPVFEEDDKEEGVRIGRVRSGKSGDMRAAAFRDRMYYPDENVVIKAVSASIGQDHYAVLDKEFCIVYQHAHVSGKGATHDIRVPGSIVDLATTPDGNIAVLHSVEGAPRLTLFNSEDGKEICQIVCRNHTDCSALSFSIDILGRFVILAKRGDTCLLSVLKNDGEHLDDHDTGLNDLRRITCGGRYFFALGKRAIHKYEINRGKVEYVQQIGLQATWSLDDVTATPADDVYGAMRLEDDGGDLVVRVGKFLDRGEPRPNAKTIISSFSYKGCDKARIDVRENWLVVAAGREFQVFALKHPA